MNILMPKGSESLQISIIPAVLVNQDNLFESVSKIAGLSATILGTGNTSITYLCLIDIDFNDLSFDKPNYDLATLVLKDCKAFSPEEVGRLVSCFPNLTSLTLDHCEGVCFKCVQKLCNLQSLEKLTLSYCGITDLGLSLLTNLSCLKCLNLQGAFITDRSLEIISELPVLHSLDVLACCGLTLDGIHTLLEDICLEDVRYKKSDLRVLQAVTDVKESARSSPSTEPPQPEAVSTENRPLFPPVLTDTKEAEPARPIQTVRAELPQVEKPANKCYRFTGIVLRYLFG